MQCVAHGLEPVIRPGEETRQGGGDRGPRGVEHGEVVVFLVAVLHHQRVGVLFEPVAGLRDDLGLPPPQEVGDHRHEGERRFLSIRDDQRAVGEAAQGGLGRFLIAARDRGDVLHFRRQAEVGERAEDFGLVLGELVHQIAEDELQRVVVLRAGAEEVQRVVEGAAAPAAELPGHPAQEQRVAGGLLVKGDALGFAGPREQRVALGRGRRGFRARPPG